MSTIINIGIFVASGVLGLIAYLLRAHMEKQGVRLDVVEKDLSSKITESEVRQIVADKIDPIKESMVEIKNKVDKVIDLLIRK